MASGPSGKKKDLRRKKNEAFQSRKRPRLETLKTKKKEKKKRLATAQSR